MSSDLDRVTAMLRHEWKNLMPGDLVKYFGMTSDHSSRTTMGMIIGIPHSYDAHVMWVNSASRGTYVQVISLALLRKL